MILDQIFAARDGRRQAAYATFSLVSSEGSGAVGYGFGRMNLSVTRGGAGLDGQVAQPATEVADSAEFAYHPVARQGEAGVPASFASPDHPVDAAAAQSAKVVVFRTAFTSWCARFSSPQASFAVMLEPYGDALIGWGPAVDHPATRALYVFAFQGPFYDPGSKAESGARGKAPR